MPSNNNKRVPTPAELIADIADILKKTQSVSEKLKYLCLADEYISSDPKEVAFFYAAFSTLENPDAFLSTNPGEDPAEVEEFKRLSRKLGLVPDNALDSGPLPPSRQKWAETWPDTPLSLEDILELYPEPDKAKPEAPPLTTLYPSPLRDIYSSGAKEAEQTGAVAGTWAGRTENRKRSRSKEQNRAEGGNATTSLSLHL